SERPVADTSPMRRSGTRLSAVPNEAEGKTLSDRPSELPVEIAGSRSHALLVTAALVGVVIIVAGIFVSTHPRIPPPPAARKVATIEPARAPLASPEATGAPTAEEPLP